jgi:hypothetical protein
VLDVNIAGPGVVDDYVAVAGNRGALNDGRSRGMFGEQGGQLRAQGFVLGQGFAELEVLFG